MDQTLCGGLVDAHFALVNARFAFASSLRICDWFGSMDKENFLRRKKDERQLKYFIHPELQETHALIDDGRILSSSDFTDIVVMFALTSDSTYYSGKSIQRNKPKNFSYPGP